MQPSAFSQHITEAGTVVLVVDVPMVVVVGPTHLPARRSQRPEQQPAFEVHGARAAPQANVVLVVMIVLVVLVTVPTHDWSKELSGEQSAPEWLTPPKTAQLNPGLPTTQPAELAPT